MKNKSSETEYVKMANEAREFSKKLMEFAFRELKEAEVKFYESDDPDEEKLSISSLKKENNLRILVEYLYYENKYSVEITDFSADNYFNFSIGSDSESAYEKLIPASIRKALRDKCLKTRPDVN